jgi:hypothetical protein
MSDTQGTVTTSSESFLEAVRRAKAEFLEMPGLRLTGGSVASSCALGYAPLSPEWVRRGCSMTAVESVLARAKAGAQAAECDQKSTETSALASIGMTHAAPSDEPEQRGRSRSAKRS